MMESKILKYKKFRLAILTCGMLLFFAVIIGRNYYIQVVDYERYRNYSKRQYFQKVRLNPKRGKILDRNLTPLAITVPAKSVYASPHRIEDREKTAAVISGELEMDKMEILKKLNSNRNFVWIKRKISHERFTALKKRKLAGVSFLDEDKRYYPKRWLAARLIGFSGMDNQGLAGIEYQYDGILKSRPIVVMAKRDALGNIYGYMDGVNQSDLQEIVITIDSNIQFLVEKILKETFERYQAKAAIAVVMDTRTGEILAAAEQPEFDPNDFISYPPTRYKSLTVTQGYEPGSTFKVFVAAAALDRGSSKPDDKFDTGKGFIMVGENTIKEASGKGYGVLTFREIISKSSNVGIIMLAQKLGDEEFYYYIKRLGFGAKTGVDIPGEATGLVREFKKWSILSLPSMSYGQELAVTPIQMVTALSVLGNGGMSVTPHILKQVVSAGKVVREFRAPAPKRIISEKAARETVNMMRLAVTNGTGRRAYIKEYDIAGKTGTAQKFDKELAMYSKDKFLSSFMALFPSDNPRFSVLVMIDEPSGAGWGGEVATPVARDIVVEMARYLGIPPNGHTRYEVDWNKLEKNFLPPKAPVKAEKDDGVKGITRKTVENITGSPTGSMERLL